MWGKKKDALGRFFDRKKSPAEKEESVSGILLFFELLKGPKEEAKNSSKRRVGILPPSRIPMSKRSTWNSQEGSKGGQLTVALFVAIKRGVMMATESSSSPQVKRVYVHVKW